MAGAGNRDNPRFLAEHPCERSHSAQEYEGMGLAGKRKIGAHANQGDKNDTDNILYHIAYRMFIVKF